MLDASLLPNELTEGRVFDIKPVESPEYAVTDLLPET